MQQIRENLQIYIRWITFPFVPKVLVLFDSLGAIMSTIGSCVEPTIGLTAQLTTAYQQQALWNINYYDGNRYYGYAKKSSDGKTISWYVTGSQSYHAGYQFNTSGTIYSFTALG